MPVGFGGIKPKVRPVEVMAHLKRSIIEVKAETNCLAYALIIAIARIKIDPDYVAYRKGRKIHPVVNNNRDDGYRFTERWGYPGTRAVSGPFLSV
jgi:hypothetical protein